MKTKQPSILFLFSSKLPGNLSLLGATLIFSLTTHNWWAFFFGALIIAAILAYRYFKQERVQGEDEKRWSREELRAALAASRAELDISRNNEAWLRGQVAGLESQLGDSQKRDNALRIIANTLTVYDKARNEVTARDAVEGLRAALVMIDRDFQRRQGEGFTAQDWEDAKEAFAGAGR